MMALAYVHGIHDLSAFRRLDLEHEVQQLVGPIENITMMRDAALYGIRDAARRKQRPYKEWSAA